MKKEEKQLIESLRQLISIRSVKYDGKETYTSAPGRPFGEGIADALSYTLSLCEAFGMRVKNCDGYAGYAEIGEGKEMIGILSHLDVVPEGNGWDYPPYGGEIHQGRLYGRGAIDDKGPALAVVFAVKELIDEGFVFGKRVRLIFGTDEENDWEDMEYYAANEECPHMGFTPDADFPLVYGEKGILQADFVMRLTRDSGLRIEGGEASNAVPDRCRVWVGDEKAPVIEETGTAAHASIPWEGDNAISKAMEKIPESGIEISDEGRRFVEFYKKKIGRCLHGEKMGCDFEDRESGKLTFNAGRIRSRQEEIRLSVDIRCPVTIRSEQVVEKLKGAADEYGIALEKIDFMKPVYSSCDSPLAKTLLAVYREETGDYREPLTMGGGTYARAMDNIVAFGPLFPGREETEHMKNEYILVDDLLRIQSIYKKAIERLCRI